MKLLKTKKHQSWLKAKRRRREIVERRQSKKTSLIGDICIKAPEILSISKNGNESIAFFEKLKSAAFERKRIKQKGRWVQSRVFVDLSTINRMSIPTAIILSAELHRWSIANGVLLRARNTKSWNPRVKNLLSDLGSFELLRANGGRKHESEDSLTLVKMKSGVKTDGAIIQELQSELSGIFEAFNAKPYIYDGLSEATNNCIDHAYGRLGGVKPRFPYAGHRWWATACYDPNSNALRFFVYDQGVGIPNTLNEREGWVRELLKLMDRDELRNDAKIVENAFAVGKTSTGLKGRGRGLNQMYEVIKSVGSGYIRVISGKGDVTMDANSVIKRANLSSHIGGTLVEWSIPIGSI